MGSHLPLTLRNTVLLRWTGEGGGKDKVVELLPLPYHKSAMEWYINKSLVRD